MSLDFKNLIVDSIEAIPLLETCTIGGVSAGTAENETVLRVHFKHQPFFLIIKVPQDTRTPGNAKDNGYAVNDIDQRIASIDVIDVDTKYKVKAIRITLEDGSYVDSVALIFSKNEYHFNFQYCSRGVMDVDTSSVRSVPFIMVVPARTLSDFLPLDYEGNHWDTMIELTTKQLYNDFLPIIVQNINGYRRSGATMEEAVRLVRVTSNWGFLYEP